MKKRNFESKSIKSKSCDILKSVTYFNLSMSELQPYSVIIYTKLPVIKLFN